MEVCVSDDLYLIAFAHFQAFLILLEVSRVECKVQHDGETFMWTLV